MMAPSPSVGVAFLIRLMFRWPLRLHMSVNRRALDTAAWIEDQRPLDRPLPWLVGLMLAVLLIWLVRDARA